MTPLSVEGPFGRLADELLAAELPHLDASRRTQTVEFVCRRAATMPTPLLVGTSVLAYGVGVARRAVGPERCTRLLRVTGLPFVGELARMVRSLGFAYIWETWPDTDPTGKTVGTRAR